MKKSVANDSAAKKSNNNEFRDEIYEIIKGHPRNEEEILELRAYPRGFVKLMGSHDGAVFLSQIIYWTERMKKRGDGFFYKSVRDWCEELDISEYQVEKARALLKTKGVLDTVKRRVANFKEQWHYRLNKERFRIVYKNFLDNEYVFPHEENIFDDVESADELIENLEDEDEAATAATDRKILDTVSCYQESIGQNEETVSSFDENFTCLQENNNSTLNNKLNSELNSEPYSSRYTPPLAEKPLAVGGIGRDDELGFRNTGGHKISDARLALDAFRSVGVTSFNVSIKNDMDTNNVIYRPDANLDLKLEESILWSERNNRSFIVRPRGGSLIQIDDCNAESLKTLQPFCFFAEETSNGNYQAWLALPAGTSKAKHIQVRERLLKTLGQDNGNGGAYGATRWVGSINFKPSRDRFRVRLVRAENGRFTSPEELENAGLLAAPEKSIEKKSSTKGFKACFPDYQRCLQDKGNDRSDADASFLAISKARGFSREKSLEKLLEVSERANESEPSYLQRTLDFVFGEEEESF